VILREVAKIMLKTPEELAKAEFKVRNHTANPEKHAKKSPQNHEN
jgi:hypothetical protein